MSVKQDAYSFLGNDITGTMEVKVWSLGAGQTAYELQDPAVNRTWRPGELKIITFHELYSLLNHPGGQFLLTHRLQVRDNKVREALGLPLDPEFLYTEDDAKKLVIEGNKDRILDALEFGPVGLASMIKHHAVNLTKDVDMIEFFNTLFQMNIQGIKASVDKIDEVQDKQKERRVQDGEKATKKQAPKRERKSMPLNPSEQANQVASTE